MKTPMQYEKIIFDKGIVKFRKNRYKLNIVKEVKTVNHRKNNNA